MKCPKCGGEIPFYDLKPNCSHCGVNIMYYMQHAGLTKDAKRTELESAAVRMVVARIKASFIGGKLAIARMVLVFCTVAVLLLPFCSVRYTVPFYDEKLSVGLLGLILSLIDGSLMNVPTFLKSALLAEQTRASLIVAGFLAAEILVCVVLFAVYLLSFLNLTKSARAINVLCIIGIAVGVAGQIAAFVVNGVTADSPQAQFSVGFGALATAVVFAALFFVNNSMLKNGIEPTYRENDIKRKELLKRVRAGEVDLDSLPLPIFESEEERAERMKALEEALKAEEEGKEL